MKIFICLTLLGLSLAVFSPAQASTWYEGGTGQPSDAAALVKSVRPGQVVVVSELHGLYGHHENQREILKQIVAKGGRVDVGMEHIDYTMQSQLDSYLAQDLSEQEFLKNIRWGSGLPFENYREQLWAPLASGGRSWGLNLPRSISGQIAKGGLGSLSPEQMALLPPGFTVGPSTYFERFRDSMKGHVPEDKIQNYFVAHSSWDDTMAWRAAELLVQNPHVTLVILVGDFHLAYQDGLVARLKARGVRDILSVSQVDSSTMTDDERWAVIHPSPIYGPRADFVFDVR